MKQIPWLYIILLICPLTNGCSYSSEPSDRTALESTFKEEFQFDAPKGIPIKVKEIRVGDAWRIWVVLSGDAKLFDKIKSKGLKAAEVSKLVEDDLFGNVNVPPWWPKRLPEKLKSIYCDDNRSNSNGNPNGTYSYCWMDDEKGEIYWLRAVWQ